MTGKKPRPSTEPIYSGGNRLDFPITSGYDSVRYTDLITSHVRNTPNILICQSMHDGYFYGCFATSKRYIPRPTVSWGRRENRDAFFEFVEEQAQEKDGKRHIYSLACDEKLGFGAFFIEKYGTKQLIISKTSRIKERWDEGFKITACAAQGSEIYAVMTKNTKEYEGKNQRWFTRKAWDDVERLIEQYEEGKVITGVCYSSKLGLYFVVMTESPENQKYKWFDEGSPITPLLNKRHKEGFHPTIIFTDQTDGAVLVVVTTDKRRSTFKAAINYKIK